MRTSTWLAPSITILILILTATLNTGQLIGTQAATTAASDRRANVSDSVQHDHGQLLQQHTEQLARIEADVSTIKSDVSYLVARDRQRSK